MTSKALNMTEKKLVSIKKAKPRNLDSEREIMHRGMMSAVSHDLKTPLSSVIGSLEVYEKLGDRLPDEKKKTLIRTALDEAYRLDNFITNILDMARLENRMVKIKKENVNMKSLVNDCLLKLGTKATDADIEVFTEKEIAVYTDLNLLSRAVYLIIDNALKFSDPNPRVSIVYGGDKHNYFIRISDNGPGIPEDKIHQIFSKYTRLSKQDHQKAGTGLGLAIAKEIVGMLGGKISVANAKKGGAVFELNFTQ